MIIHILLNDGALNFAGQSLHKHPVGSSFVFDKVAYLVVPFRQDPLTQQTTIHVLNYKRQGDIIPASVALSQSSTYVVDMSFLGAVFKVSPDRSGTIYMWNIVERMHLNLKQFFCI